MFELEKLFRGSQKQKQPITPESQSGTLSPEQKKKIESLKKESISGYISRNAQNLFFALGLFTPPVAFGQNTQIVSEKEKVSITSIETLKKDRSFDVDSRFVIQDESGSSEFNPWGLIAPIQVEYDLEKKTEGKTVSFMPYRYAETFKEIEKAASPEEQERMREALIKVMQKDFSKAFHDLWFGKTTEQVYRHKNNISPDPSIEGVQNVDIKEIVIKGLASPEAGDPKSLHIDSVDQKNLELAQDRAEDLSPLIKEALSRMGIDTNGVQIKYEEVQFTSEEFATMVNLAVSLGYITAESNVDTGLYGFVVDYNDGKITDQKVTNAVDDIMAKKRGVAVEVSYEGTDKNTYVIPIPLALLLLPGIRRFCKKINWKDFWKRMKQTRETESNQTSPERSQSEESQPAPNQPRQIFSETTLDKKTINTNEQNFHTIYRSAIETEQPTKQDLENISYLVYDEEIYTFMHHEPTIQRGLDYYNLVQLAGFLRQEQPPHYKRDEEIKEKLAEEILGQWQMYDRNVRAGIKTTDFKDLPPDQTIVYRHDPKKILWAKEAAEHIFALSSAGDDHELEKMMDDRMKELDAQKEQKRKTQKIPGPSFTEVKTQIEQQPEKKVVKMKTAEPKASKDQVVKIVRSVAENKKKSISKITKQVEVPKQTPEEALYGYEKHKQDVEELGTMMGGFTQALSPENLKAMYGTPEKTEQDKKRERIEEINRQLQQLEQEKKSLEDSLS